MDKKKSLRVPYALTVFDKSEIKAVNEVLQTSQIVAGKRVTEFENKIAHLFGKKKGVLVNSGSSANLLALEILNLSPGSEIITPALTFATTVSPMVKLGLIPAFVDVQDDGTYLLNIDQIEKIISKKTRAIMVPSLFGNIPDLPRLKAISRKYKLFLIEDSCDTVGATISGKPTGIYSDISTTSFYASHIITAAGEGGMVCVNNPALERRLRILSGWGRQSSLNETEQMEQRMKGRINNEPYDSKFIFSEIGYNMRITDISAAFGLAQLQKLNKFSTIRSKNFATLKRFFSKYEKYFVLPRQNTNIKTNWLAFPLTIREKTPFSRNEITRYLEYNNIQTRPLFTGNILKQPGFEKIKRVELKDGYPVAEYIMRNSFVIGCHHGLEKQHIDYIKNIFSNFLDARIKLSSFRR